MKGEFCYKIKGSKNELHEAEILLDKVANGEITNHRVSSSDINKLLIFKEEITENTEVKNYSDCEKDTHILIFNSKGYIDIKRLDINFNEVAMMLSTIFVDLRIEGHEYFPSMESIEDFLSNHHDFTFLSRRGMSGRIISPINNDTKNYDTVESKDDYLNEDSDNCTYWENLSSDELEAYQNIFDK